MLLDVVFDKPRCVLVGVFPPAFKADSHALSSVDQDIEIGGHLWMAEFHVDFLYFRTVRQLAQLSADFFKCYFLHSV